MRKKSNKHRSDDFKVGKNRPPVGARWKSGQSGNPRGRPKRTRSRVTIFNDALNQKLTIQDKGKTSKISIREGIVRNMMVQALKGNLKAIASIIAKEPEMARQAKAAMTKTVRPVSPEEAARAYQRLIHGEE
jgi:uncharacterized protein YbcI